MMIISHLLFTSLLIVCAFSDQTVHGQCGNVKTVETNHSRNGVLLPPKPADSCNHCKDICTWEIIAPEGSQIKFHFDHLDLGNSQSSCQDEWMEIRNEIAEGSAPIFKTCHIDRTLFQWYNASSNVAYVSFKYSRNDSVEERFKLRWQIESQNETVKTVGFKSVFSDLFSGDSQSGHYASKTVSQMITALGLVGAFLGIISLFLFVALCLRGKCKRPQTGIVYEFLPQHTTRSNDLEFQIADKTW